MDAHLARGLGVHRLQRPECHDEIELQGIRGIHLDAQQLALRRHAAQELAVLSSRLSRNDPSNARAPTIVIDSGPQPSSHFIGPHPSSHFIGVVL